MTALLAEAIERLLRENDPERVKAEKRFLDRIRNAPDRGTHGTVQWTRDELHER